MAINYWTRQDKHSDLVGGREEGRKELARFWTLSGYLAALTLTCFAEHTIIFSYFNYINFVVFCLIVCTYFDVTATPLCDCLTALLCLALLLAHLFALLQSKVLDFSRYVKCTLSLNSTLCCPLFIYDFDFPLDRQLFWRLLYFV